MTDAIPRWIIISRNTVEVFELKLPLAEVNWEHKRHLDLTGVAITIVLTAKYLATSKGNTLRFLIMWSTAKGDKILSLDER